MAEDKKNPKEASNIFHSIMKASVKDNPKPKDTINYPNRTIIASDVSNRDGIGVEVYRDNELVIEIFRDDTKRTRTVTLFKWDIPLDIVEESIATFKKEIPWDFIEY